MSKISENIEDIENDMEQLVKSDFAGFGDNLCEEEESSLFTPVFSSKPDIIPKSNLYHSILLAR